MSRCASASCERLSAYSLIKVPHKEGIIHHITYHGLDRIQLPRFTDTMGLYSLLYLALLAAFGATVFALPVNSPGPIAHMECTPRVAMRRTRNGNPGNCAKALMDGFPNGPIVGQFHRGGEANAFRLPQTSIVGDCQVSVDLNGVERVQGSWQEIWTLANTMSTACTYYINQQYASTAVTGGYVHGGQGNGLAIFMGRPADLANSETGVATE